MFSFLHFGATIMPKLVGYYWAKYMGTCPPEIVFITNKNEVFKVGCEYDFELESWVIVKEVESCSDA